LKAAERRFYPNVVSNGPGCVNLMALPGYWRQGDYLYSSKDGFTASPETRYRPPQTLNLTALGFISSRTKIGSTPVNFSGAPAFSVAARRRRGSVHSETSCFLGSIWKCASFPRNLQKTLKFLDEKSPYKPSFTVLSRPWISKGISDNQRYGKHIATIDDIKL